MQVNPRTDLKVGHYIGKERFLASLGMTRRGSFMSELKLPPPRKKKLDGALDAEFAHAGLEGGALDAEDGGGAAWAGDAPLGLAEDA